MFRQHFSKHQKHTCRISRILHRILLSPINVLVLHRKCLFYGAHYLSIGVGTINVFRLTVFVWTFILGRVKEAKRDTPLFVVIHQKHDSMQHTGSNRSYSQHWTQYLMNTAVKCDVVSLNRLHPKYQILEKGALTNIIRSCLRSIA
jgi:hypothetical protein